MKEPCGRKDDMKGRAWGLWGGSEGRAVPPDLLDVLCSSASCRPESFKSLLPLRQTSSWTQPIYIPAAALEEAGPGRRGRGGRPIAADSKINIRVKCFPECPPVCPVFVRVANLHDRNISLL